MRNINITEKTLKEEVGTMKPIGKENVAKCIKNIGEYIIQNAEKISDNVDDTVSIDIHGNITVDELPTVEISYTNQITDLTMFGVETIK